ncbi:MAG: XdhC family protein, partial [Chloroflexi bacterium]|nr:XdhC family protein [Chloroflexota bacterium]
MQLEVTRELLRLMEAGEPFALATLVDAHGSTPQKVGARLLVRADGTATGTLGGGCIEAEVLEVAMS